MNENSAGPWFDLALEVRDYELDLQGIVNNAIYFHYYEHARHAFITARGLSIAAMHEAGLDPVVYRAEIDYREPLRSGDRFLVRVRASTEGRLKLVFEERIVKQVRGQGGGERECSRARFVIALTKGGRPLPIPADLGDALRDPVQAVAASREG